MKKEILCFGDSNTWGCVPRQEDTDAPSERYSADIRWTGRLAALLGEEYHVIEEGLEGRTSVYDYPGEPWRSGLAYFQPCLLSHRPLDLVVLMLGTSDLYACLRPSQTHLGDGIRTLVRMVRAMPQCGRNGKPPAVLIAAPGRIGEGRLYPQMGGGQGEALSRKFAPVYRKAAEELKCGFLDASLYTAPSAEDGVHWSEESHQRLAEAMAGAVRKILR